MLIRKHSFAMKMIALVLAFAIMTPCNVSAVTSEPIQPYASKYLTSYNTYVCAMGSGKVEVWFNVMGTGTMDEIGVLSIKLYESTDQTNWTRVKTYSHENYSSMLEESDYYHCSYVSYQGTAGKYYKAYVCIWAGKNGSGDTRYMWTSVERAT